MSQDCPNTVQIASLCQSRCRHPRINQRTAAPPDLKAPIYPLLYCIKSRRKRDNTICEDLDAASIEPVEIYYLFLLISPIIRILVEKGHSVHANLQTDGFIGVRRC